MRVLEGVHKLTPNECPKFKMAKIMTNYAQLCTR